jgi:dipeptide/tripeptide permease
MKKFFYYSFGLISVATGICFMYMFFKGQYNSMLVAAGIECCFSTVLFIMLEPRPRKTQAQIRHDNTVKNQGLGLLVMITLAVVVILFASSCTANRYGCGHGNPKMNWNKMVRSINRP